MRWAEAPPDEATLLDRATALAGRTMAEVAEAVETPVPPDLKRHKGWIGTVLEAALGATASNRPVPDFEALGIELKTIPMTARGKVKESTFVCTAPMDGRLAATWEESRVQHKLSRVLWMPVVGDGPPGERIVGQGVLWSPDADEEKLLRDDWTELSDLLALGEHWQLDARRGQVLQLRPKAAHSATLMWTLGDEGDWVQEGPRGFYLRATFTAGLLARRLRC